MGGGVCGDDRQLRDDNPMRPGGPHRRDPIAPRHEKATGAPRLQRRPRPYASKQLID
jgi:hypothetical protein